MTRIAYLVTSARELTLADGTQHPTGYFAEEALKPYERFADAGFEVTVITPDGQPPYADPYGLSWFFHYPEQDKDYLASVVRTFAHDVDDIRLTLHQNTELGLAAARRVAARLQEAVDARPRRTALSATAAKTAWRQDRPFADVLASRTARARAHPAADPARGRRAAGGQPAAVRRAAPRTAADSRLPASAQRFSSLTDARCPVRRGVHARRARADGRHGR